MNGKDTLYLLAIINFQQQKRTQSVYICKIAHPAPYFEQSALPLYRTRYAT